MKKIFAILLVMMMSITVCSAEVVLFPDETNTLKSCFTDAIKNENNYVKYDEATNAVIAYATESAQRIGTLDLPAAITEDGISFEFTAKANSATHIRAKIFFRDSQGGNIFDIAFTKNSDGDKVSFMREAGSASAINNAFYVLIGEETKINVTFDFSNKKAVLSVAKPDGEKWIWCDGFEKTLNGTDFKTLAISNEWSTADASLYNFKVTVPEAPEPEIPDVFENAIYKRAYKEDFANGAKGFTGSVSTDRWVKYDAEEGNIHAYNSPASGSNTGKLVFDKAITENGAKIAFTYTTSELVEKHRRMKLHFVNSKNEKMHSINIISGGGEDDKYSAIAEALSQISYSLYKAEPGVPVRVEMSFDFTNKTVTYRTGWISENGYEFKNYSKTTDYNDGAAATAWDIKEIQFVNEYSACDVRIDDVEVYVPKLSFVSSAANPEEYAISYTIKNNTDEAITGDIICAVYGEDNSLTEVKILPDANIETTLTDAFMFDIAEDFTNYAIYVWSDIGEMIPVSMGYSSF